MAIDSPQGSGNWPMPSFYFQVRWDAAEMQFQEISGLDVETQAIEYRAGDSAQFSVQKMPGLKRFSDVTMKKGVFKGDHQFWDWFNEIKTNTIKRKPVTISLLDESGTPTMVWTLANAWPSKLSGTDLQAGGNEVAIETLVIAHEGLTLVRS
jgi:phage tail-like protein